MAAPPEGGVGVTVAVGVTVGVGVAVAGVAVGVGVGVLPVVWKPASRLNIAGPGSR